MNRYVKHVVHNSSLYPLGTFWLAAMVVVPLTFTELLSHAHGAVILSLTALFLLLVTDRRDEHNRTAALRDQVTEVHDLVVDRADSQDAKIDHLTDVADKETDKDT